MALAHLVSTAGIQRKPQLIALLLGIADSVVALTIPWLAGQYAARVLADAPAGTGILFLLMACLALQALLKFASNFVMGRTASKLLADLQVRVYDHLQALSLGFHQKRPHGDLLALLTHEVAQFASFVTSTLLSVPAAVLTAAGAVALMVRLDPWLAVFVAVLVPAFFFLLKLIGRKLRPLARDIQQADAAAAGIAWENLSMLPAIKTFTRESHESARYAKHVQRVQDLVVRELRIQSALEPALQLIATIGVVLMLWLVQATHGHMDAAQLVSFMLYAALLTRPISALAGVYGQFQMARGTFARLESVLNEASEPIDEGAEMPKVQGTIEFDAVHFSYEGRDAGLQAVDLRVEAGETVALTGENGSGKTTLVHLLLRLYEPASGRILVDGIEIRTVKLHSLRRQIGIVPQHVLLFNGSVRDNIGFGLLGASNLMIEHAARSAQAHEFIQRLPDGYDTVVGDDGVRLSGGERQRLALARALLKDPPILILDEATSMFDPAGEASLLRDCAEVFAKRTVLLITHRPASLGLADRVLTMRDGRVHGTMA